MNRILIIIAKVIAIFAIGRSIIILFRTSTYTGEYLMGHLLGNAILLVVAVGLYKYASKRSAA